MADQLGIGGHPQVASSSTGFVALLDRRSRSDQFGQAAVAENGPKRADSECMIILTIDTEPDDAWTNHLNPSVANVLQLLRLQDILDRYGAKATCLVTTRVVENDVAVKVLLELQKRGAEIGAHLHPWETPPFMASGLDRQYPSFPHELPLPLFEAKLARLTTQITERFGPPRSYRAGRWGLTAEHLPVLERLGYLVDSSVFPLEDWRDTLGIPRELNGCGGVEYLQAPCAPYHPSYTHLRRQGGSRILEVPVTVGFSVKIPNWIRRLYGRAPVAGRKLARGLFAIRPIWAAVAQLPAEHWPLLLDDVRRRRPPVVNITVHSSQLTVNGSPQTRTKRATDAIFERIESALTLGRSGGRFSFETLSGLRGKWAAPTGGHDGVERTS